MGVAIPQVVTEDRASGAQVIDGSLRFDGTSQYLQRTPSSAGNRRTFTWSSWVKYSKNQNSDQFWAGTDINNNWRVRGTTNGEIRLQAYSGGSNIGNEATNAYLRDFSGWYNLVYVVDTTQSTAADRQKIYINGVLQTSLLAQTSPNQNTELYIDSTNVHRLGAGDSSSSGAATPDYFWAGQMSQVYFIDGQALGPEYFGYTDALTGTWRPKKYTGNFGGDLILAAAPYSSTSKFNAYNTYGTVVENATGYTLPMSNPAHYGGKAKNLTTGGFRVDTTNSAAEDFFFGCWVKFDVAPTSSQIGINLSGSYVYFEVRTSGVIRIRHTGGNSSDSAGTSVSDGNWHHIALSRSGNTLYGFVDGTAVVSTTSGVTGNSVGENSQFWFFGGDGTTYNVDGQIIDPFIYIGQGVSSYTTPTSPLIDGSGNINHFSTFSDTEAFYISPGVDVSGSDPNTVSDYYPNGFYLPFDGSAPIGEDKSGNGNDWTPVNFNFGGSAALDKATGALPILNTFGSNGKTALPSVRDDSAVGAAATCVLALPLVGSANDVSNQINSGSTTKTVTVTNAVASSAQSNFYGGSWYFDGTGDWVNVSGESDFAFGTGDFTIECWAYTTTHTSSSRIINQDYDNNGNGTGTFLFYRNGSTMQFYSSNDGSNWDNVSGLTIGVIPVNTWTHLAVTRLNGTVYTWLNGIQQNSVSGNGNITNTGNVRIGCYGAGTAEFWNGYIQDLRIYKGVAKYTSNFIPASTNPDILPDTPSGVSGSSKLTKVTDGAVSFDGTGDYLRIAATSDFDQSPGTDFTAEAYIYMTAVSGPSHIMGFQVDGNNRCSFYFTDGTTTLNWYTNLSGSGSNKISTPSNYVSLNAWHHVAVTRSGSTTYLFVDGILQGTSTTTDYPSGNQLLDIGTYNASSYNPDSFPGFISNVRIIKGTALYTSDFTPPSAPLTDVTNTKLLCCKSNTSATAFDVSPGTITANGNAAATNFNPFTTDINAVRGQETGYATLNPLNNTSCTLSEGNLKFVTAGNNSVIWATQPIPTYGKWYFESTFGGGDMAFMLDQKASRTPTNVNTTATGLGIYMYFATGSTSNRFQTNSTDTAFNSSFTTDTVGDVYGFEVDMDAGTIRVRKQDGSDSGLFTMPDALKSAPLFPGFSVITTWPVVTQTLNFGQKPFKYAPPEGFLPLNAANARPSTVIARPDQYVGIVTYTGLGNSGMKVSGYNFKPDLIWIKARNQTYNNILYDSVRGTGQNTAIFSDDTAVEGSYSQYVNLSSFDSDGFTVGSTGANNNAMSSSSANFVAWCWKRSIKSGFDIVTHTNTDDSTVINHNLGKTPEFIITKSLTGGTQWRAYHVSGGVSQTAILSTTESFVATAERVTAVSDTTFTYNATVSANGTDFIHYVWTSIPGFSKFGSYTGNNSADGPMIVTGFRPRWLMIKDATTGGLGQDWVIIDTARDKHNVVQSKLYANLSNSEDTNTNNAVDILSNGFKLKSTNSATNASNDTYIYAAWAEAPSFNLYGAQSNAR